MLEAEVGKLGDNARRLVAILELLPLDRFLPSWRGWNGRPARDRHAIASAFVAKAVYNLPRTRDLLDRLRSDEQLRLICGWKVGETLPHESTFSRAFAEFAEMELGEFVHEALVGETQQSRLIGHIAREVFPDQPVKSAQDTSPPKPRKSLKVTKLGPP